MAKGRKHWAAHSGATAVVGVRIPLALREHLLAEAKRRKRTLSWLIREAIVAYLDKGTDA